MKRMTLLLLFLLLITAGCKGEAAETSQIPLVAGLSQSTAIPDNFLAPTKMVLPRAEQEEMVTPYPAPIPTSTIEVSEMPLATAVPDVMPENYPAPVETRVELGEQPLPSVEPTAVVVDNLDFTEFITETMNFGFQIVNEFPHDRSSYVQGLVVEESGMMLEGSGLRGQSSLRRVLLETGEVVQYLPLSEQYFGEGITLFDERIFQLTYRSGLGFVYESDSFSVIDTFNYSYEGWGITHDGDQLIVSDGTDTLHFWDPETLQETDQLYVRDESGPVTQLNELEFVNGEILANIYMTDTIVRINPDSGEVRARIDLTGLLAEEDRDGTEGVLNGIAYDQQTERLFVTGKKWPFLYEIELVPLDSLE